jgi:uncharacterized protein YecT (DUF1311 family)
MLSSNAVVLALLATTNAYAQYEVADALKDCDKNELTIATCAKHAADTTDAELNRLYKQILAVMITPEAKQRLKLAQRTWIELRDRDCLVLVGPRSQGGSMYSGLWSRCLERRTRERVVELKKLQQLLKCEERPCPPNE